MNIVTKITYQTTDDQIRNMTCGELKEALSALYHPLSQMKGFLKHDYVEMAKKDRDEMILDHEREERRRKHEHEQALERDHKDATFVQLKKDVTDRLEELVVMTERSLDVLRKSFPKEASAARWLKWNTESTYKLSAQLGVLQGLLKLATDEAVTPTMTKEEYLETWKELEDDALDRMLTYDILSIPERGIDDAADLYVHQFRADAIRSIFRCWKRDEREYRSRTRYFIIRNM